MQTAANSEMRIETLYQAETRSPEKKADIGELFGVACLFMLRVSLCKAMLTYRVLFVFCVMFVFAVVFCVCHCGHSTDASAEVA